MKKLLQIVSMIFVVGAASISFAAGDADISNKAHQDIHNAMTNMLTRIR